jgi:hypothetical protein
MTEKPLYERWNDAFLAADHKLECRIEIINGKKTMLPTAERCFFTALFCTHRAEREYLPPDGRANGCQEKLCSISFQSKPVRKVTDSHSRNFMDRVTGVNCAIGRFSL